MNNNNNHQNHLQPPALYNEILSPPIIERHLALAMEAVNINPNSLREITAAVYVGPDGDLFAQGAVRDLIDHFVDSETLIDAFDRVYITARRTDNFLSRMAGMGVNNNIATRLWRYFNTLCGIDVNAPHN